MSRSALTLIVGLTVAPVPVLLGQIRDGGGLPSGTAIIAGRVLSNDAQPRPIRRAIVTVSGSGVPGGRSVLTDDDGAFEITALAAGRYFLSAEKAAYLPSVYGAIRPGRTGSAIALEAGQRATAILKMLRGGVLQGTVSDEYGVPAAGALVTAINARAELPTAPAATRPVTADDRGAFRIFGLMPGEYYISATPRIPTSGAVDQRTPEEIDSALANLRLRLPGPAPSRPPAAAERVSVTYAAIFFPGVSQLRHAQRVQIGIEEERTGLDFVVAPVRVASIEGTISGSVPNLSAVQLSLTFLNDQGDPSGVVSTSGSPVLSDPPDATGRFRYTSVRPGTYRIVARASTDQMAPTNAAASEAATFGVGVSGGSGRGAGGMLVADPARPPGDYQYATIDVSVDGHDVSGISLPLRSGSTFAGRIQFDGKSLSRPADLTTWQVQLVTAGGSYMARSGNTLLGTSLNSARPAPTDADGHFLLPNIAPGRYLLNVVGPERKDGWWIRSAMSGGVDLMDMTLEIAPGADLTDVVVALSDSRTQLGGTLQTPDGSPAPDYFVVAFPSDQALWRPNSRRVQVTRPATDGRFVIRDLPPGDYLIAALIDVTPADLNDPAFLRAVLPGGLPVSLADGEQRVHDLRLANVR